MSKIKAGTTSTTAYQVEADTTGTLVLQTGATPTTALTISSSQVATFAQAPVLPAASIPQAALAANVAGNGPAFFVYRTGSDQGVSNNTNTVVLFNGTTFDTASAYTAATGKFQPTVAGYYQINATLFLTGGGITLASGDITKNGGSASRIGTLGLTFTSTPVVISGSTLVYLNGSTDYAQVNAYISASASQVVNQSSTFSGVLVKAA